MKSLWLFLACLAVCCPARGDEDLSEARLLGALRGGDSVPRLVAALRHANGNVRFHAAYALGEIKDPSAAPALLQALRDPEWCVRDQAAWALREIQQPDLVAPLSAMLKEEGADLPHLVWLLQHYGATAAVAPYLPRQAPAPAPALVAHWSFDDRSATLAKEVSGQAVHGAIQGCAVAEGKQGAALRFGPGRYVELGRAPRPSVANTPFTIMAWIKPEAPDGVVVARGGAACGFSLYLKGGVPKFGIRRTADGPPDLVSAAEPAGTDWTHLAGVVRQDRLELFVNGKLAGTAPCGGCLPGNGGQGMEIGFDAGNSAVELTDAFVGLIDEVKQFNTALSPEELAGCQ